MKIDLENRKRILSVVALAFFNFVFLGAEYMFDNMMTYVASSESVVLAESYILGASCMGFFLYPILDKIISGSSKYIIAFASALAGIICIFTICRHSSYMSVLLPGCLLFAVLGILGGEIHYIFSVVISERKHLAENIGIAYALGIFMQFINNNLVFSELGESVFVAVTLAVFVVLIMKLEDYIPDENVLYINGMGNMKSPLIAGVALTLAVVLMSCIFSTLNISVTLVHAGGSVDIGQWPRLILALSGLMAGFIYDIGERKYMNITMYCVTLLSTICVVVTELGGPFLVGLILFYISAGFFVVFFSTAFIELSGNTKVPKLFAGLGRATNNLCAILTGALSVALLKNDVMLIIITALCLFALISIVLYIYSNQFERKTDTDEKEKVTYEADEEEKFRTFCEKFSLTPRESEVLKTLLISDENVQDIAVKISMSRAVLYRHITNLNNKTDTKSRIGLIQFYYNWRKNV